MKGNIKPCGNPLSWVSDFCTSNNLGNMIMEHHVVDVKARALEFNDSGMFEIKLIVYS